MQVYVYMMLFVLAFASVFAFGCKYVPNKINYFTIDETSTLKGFWCIVVVLVHIPEAYQNQIQDAMGSFAYIGVTFFFFAAGFGLKYGVLKKEEYLRSFWKKRLPKILIPVIVLNIIYELAKYFIAQDEITFGAIVSIGNWVRLLLLCYFVFWLVYNLPKLKSHLVICDVLICLFIIGYSVACYLDLVWISRWIVEPLGFAYGVLFANVVGRFKTGGNEKWWLKLFASISASLILGILYLMFKPVPFWGDYILKIILGISLTTMILLLLVRFKIGNPLTRFLGKISYEVYLSHSFSFYLLSKFVPSIGSAEFVIAAVALTIVIAFVIYIISKNIETRLSKYI